MKAKEARQLRVGDWVMANFSNYAQAAKVVAIEWPHFVIVSPATKRRGPLKRTRRYRSLWKCDNAPRDDNRPPPAWLKWPGTKERPSNENRA